MCEHCGGKGHLSKNCFVSPAAVHFRLSLNTRKEIGFGKDSAPHFEIRPDGDAQPEVLSTHLSLRRLEEELDKILESSGESLIKPNTHILLETHEFRGMAISRNDAGSEASASSSVSTYSSYGEQCPGFSVLQKVKKVLDKNLPIHVFLTAEAPSSQRHNPLQLLSQSRLSWLTLVRPFVEEATLCCQEDFLATTSKGIVPEREIWGGSDKRWLRNRIIVKLGTTTNPSFSFRVKSSLLPPQAENPDPRMQRALIAVGLGSRWSPPAFNQIWRPWAEAAGVAATRINQPVEIDWCGTESRGWYRVVLVLMREEILKLQETQPEGVFLAPWSIFQIPEASQLGKWLRLSPGKNVMKDAHVLMWLKQEWEKAIQPAADTSKIPEKHWMMPSGVNTLRVWVPMDRLGAISDAVKRLREADPAARIHAWDMRGNPALPWDRPFSPPAQPRTFEPRAADGFFHISCELEEEIIVDALKGLPLEGGFKLVGNKKKVEILFKTIEDAQNWFEATWEVYPGSGVMISLRPSKMPFLQQQMWRSEKFKMGSEKQAALIASARNF